MTAVSLVMLESENNGDISVKEHTISGVSYSPEGTVDGIEQSTEVKINPSGAVYDIAAVSALCNDAIVVAGNDPKTESKRAFERIGEPTEAALCVLTEKLGGFAETSSASTPQLLASANVNKWREFHTRQATLGKLVCQQHQCILCFTFIFSCLLFFILETKNLIEIESPCQCSHHKRHQLATDYLLREHPIYY